MSGGGEAEDNPVNINVVPMVDVIFCLCVFFMCSFKFKEMEGKFQSWLPTDKGNGGTPPDDLIEMRVAMYWDEQNQVTKRQFVTHMIQTDDELESILKGAHEDNVRQGKGYIPCIIDADAKVPWDQVMLIVNMCKRLGIEKIEFALGAGAPTTR